MTAGELQDLLVHTLVRDAGGTRRRWRIVLGPVRIFDDAGDQCNWMVAPSGGRREITEVERLLDRVRHEHPVVVED